ncbi:hypothetical protein [Rhizobium leguminosarum]|uniref:hypothetical protein n=1 Tax=Rhizobium leguminosarum TaxID=384 RepID=UPI001C93AD1E|nr:hypothetical protein [Rhizobium leguminosarum]MBY5664533.1 hypothetical protein [Rhizobium leguminosarum]MBY5677783.1 hypothetical protein [Rhizobium leguminosarum]
MSVNPNSPVIANAEDESEADGKNSIDPQGSSKNSSQSDIEAGSVATGAANQDVQQTQSVGNPGDTNAVAQPPRSDIAHPQSTGLAPSGDVPVPGNGDSSATGDKSAAADPPQDVPGSANSMIEASKRLAQNPETWRTSRALVLALVILAMTTLPALYISFIAIRFVVALNSFQSPGSITNFIFAYAVIKSDLFNLFTVAALPTLTAYFGSSDSKYREGFLPWLLFTYFVLLFVSTFVPEVVADPSYTHHAAWTTKVEAIAAKTADIKSYLTNVRNSAIGGIAVLTGIKLAG